LSQSSAPLDVTGRPCPFAACSGIVIRLRPVAINGSQHKPNPDQRNSVPRTTSPAPFSQASGLQRVDQHKAGL
jgi:hypothetical protein